MGSTLSNLVPQTSHTQDQGFHPNAEDIRLVRHFMRHFLPTELVDIILDHACYWSLARVRMSYEGHYLTLNASRSIDNDGAVCVLLTPKMCVLTNALCEQAPFRIRRLAFNITSHDQGWSPVVEQKSLYEDSFTWFEAVIIRNSIYDTGFDVASRYKEYYDHHALNSDIKAAVNTRTHDKIPKITTVKYQEDELSSAAGSSSGKPAKDTWHVQTNVRGSRHSTVHAVVWDREPASGIDEAEHYKRTGSTLGRGFVSALQRSDRIAVVSRAKYPGFINYIGSVDLEVYHSVR